MSTPTTQTADTPAISAAANTVVASSATPRSSSASGSVATSIRTTSSSPKPMMSLGEYKKARDNTVFARDELEAPFDVGSDADMEDGEEKEETSSSRRDDPSVGSRRPCEDDSDASSPRRSRSGSDRPLADAGLLSRPQRGGDSTPSGVATRGCPSPYALYSCSGITDNDVTKELDFDPATDQRPDYDIGLSHELRWYGNKKTSRRSRVLEWQALCQSWGAFVEDVNKNPSGYRERDRLARERYKRFSNRPKIERLHGSAVEAGIPCAEILFNECENDPDLGSGSDDQQFAGRSSEFPPVRLAMGVEAAGRRRGSDPQDSVDRLEAVERLQIAEFAALKQELALLKAQLAQVAQTASNVQVDLGSKLNVLRTRVGALEKTLAPRHQD
ncbi:unnamed protein product [Phytophthora fragariaefolia]|uniref:Unnamed protein product n=1 Tax=Phytophthora fragariaefolia TaxID=1490495 RepID=A0A9W6Y6F1_9STRA|nr:unnamed protein product [Phytophthora fragariaefolia]